MRRPEMHTSGVPEQPQETRRTRVKEPVTPIRKRISQAMISLLLAASSYTCGPLPQASKAEHTPKPTPTAPLLPEGPQCAENPLSPGEHRVILSHEHTPEEGLEFWYVVSGIGPVVILPSPGWGVGSDIYADLVDENGNVIVKGLETILRELGFTVVRFDTRGSGRSERPAGDPSEIYNFNVLKYDLQALINHLRVKIFIIAGHSMGSTIAMDHAANCEQLEGWKCPKVMILISALPLVKDPEQQAAQDAAFAKLQSLPGFAEAWAAFEAAMKTTDDAKMKEYFGRMATLYFNVTEETLPFFNTLLGSQEYNASAKVAWMEADLVLTPDLAAKIPSDICTAIINGTNDAHSLPLDAKRIHALISNSTLAMIEGGAHLPWTEYLAQFTWILRTQVDHALRCSGIENNFTRSDVWSVPQSRDPRKRRRLRDQGPRAKKRHAIPRRRIRM